MLINEQLTIKAISFLILISLETACGQIKPVTGTLSIDKSSGKLDMQSLQHLQEYDTLSIQLSSSAMNFKSTDIEKGCFFNGMDERGSQLNLLQKQSYDGSSYYVGNIVDVPGHKITHINRNADGDTVFKTMSINEFQDEEEDLMGLPFELNPTGHRLRRARNLHERRFLNRHSNRELSRNDTANINIERDLDTISVIDILVVWTKAAECSSSGLYRRCTVTAVTTENMRELIDLAIFETNTAYAASGIKIKLNLVHAYMNPDYVEHRYSTTLAHLATRHDGFLDEVHTKRSEYRADLVAMIVDLRETCGKAYMGPGYSKMFSVTSWICTTGYYSFGHELGHNFGCEHDRGSKSACNDEEYAFGYRDKNAQFRSIMAYNCNPGQCDKNYGGGCSRVQIFSNNYHYLYRGQVAGDQNNDCAKQINSVRGLVSSYF